MASPTKLPTLQLGETLSVRRQTENDQGVLAAPDGLSFFVKAPHSPIRAEYMLDTDAEVETIAVGDYQLNILTDQVGFYNVKVVLTYGEKVTVEHLVVKVEDDPTL